MLKINCLHRAASAKLGAVRLWCYKMIKKPLTVLMGVSVDMSSMHEGTMFTTFWLIQLLVTSSYGEAKNTRDHCAHGLPMSIIAQLTYVFAFFWIFIYIFKSSSARTIGLCMYIGRSPCR